MHFSHFTVYSHKIRKGQREQVSFKFRFESW